MKIVRPVSEAEAIGEFLKNEYYEADYNSDRDQWESIVVNPDYADAQENALRRALLFRRRGHMWREIPADAKWYQVQLAPVDMDRIHVFPRAQWSKISDGSYCIGDIIRRIKSKKYTTGSHRVITKIQQLRYRLQIDPHSTSTVLLIGVDEQSPVTILEGNHRLSAAMLVGPDLASSRFNVFCAMSPRMVESCWYKTNLPNLWRYAKNRLKHMVDREADIKRLHHKPGLNPTSNAMVTAVASKNLTETQS